MATVVFLSPKGGVGKSTAALILATQLAKAASVSVVDADPNAAIHLWCDEGKNESSNFSVAQADENDIEAKIQAAAQKSAFVVVDLEGSASTISLLALSLADFVVVPMQASPLDARQAGRALRSIAQVERMSQRRQPDYTLPYAILLTQTNSAIRTRTLKHIEKNLIDANVPLFDVELNNRDAYRAMFAFNQTLENLNPGEVPSLDAAITNAEAFATEVIAKLRSANISKEAA